MNYHKKRKMKRWKEQKNGKLEDDGLLQEHQKNNSFMLAAPFSIMKVQQECGRRGIQHILSSFNCFMLINNCSTLQRISNISFIKTFDPINDITVEGVGFFTNDNRSKI